jgi:hypothetical protein
VRFSASCVLPYAALRRVPPLRRLLPCALAAASLTPHHHPARTGYVAPH